MECHIHSMSITIVAYNATWGKTLCRKGTRLGASGGLDVVWGTFHLI